jgi:short-subunit dehydrogenase
MTRRDRALVTGASSGIGAALARQLAARGIEVWLAARRVDLLEEQARQIVAAGGTAHVVKLDVADGDETVRRLEELDDEVGGFDLVVANAGIGGRGPLAAARLDWPEVRGILQTNLLGAAATLTPFMPRMVARGRGHLVAISSLGADLPLPRSAPYCGAKAGLSAFLEAADIDLRPRGVAVTIVHPGFVRTPAVAEITDPMPLIMSEERAARIIDHAIARRVRIVRFPWIMGALARLVQMLPRAIKGPLIQRTLGERSLPARRE